MVVLPRVHEMRDIFFGVLPAFIRKMEVYTLALASAISVFQAAYGEGNPRDVLIPFGGDVREILPPVTSVAPTGRKFSRNRSSLPAGTNDEEASADTDHRRNFGQPCARDDDCLPERGLSCQEWVCRCAFDTPVRVQAQGIDTCLAEKYLYEACRYNQECSHRSANMRCVDFLCYCPLPFELRANGDCLEARPSVGKLIVAIAPAALLLVILGTIGGTFLFRKIFRSGEKDGNNINLLRQNEQIRSTQRSAATASVSMRTGPLKSWRLQKLEPPTKSPSPRPAPSPVPFTRLLRVPPDKLTRDTFSPDTTSTTTVMKTSSFSPPVPFEKSSLTPFDKSSRHSAGRPPHLSVTRLMEKVFRSSTDSSEDGAIVLRVRRDSNRGPPAPKPSQKNSLALARSGQRRELLSFRKDNTANKDADESITSYEWGVTAPTQAATRDKTVAAETEERPEKNTEQDNRSPHTLFSSFRQSKCVTFADDAKSGAASDHQCPGKPPANTTLEGVPAARSDGGMRLGSLKAETRWLSQDSRSPAALVDAGRGERQQFWKSGLAQGDKDADAITAKSSDEDKSRTETSSRGAVLSLGERNRLGVGTPFVGTEDSPFAESASIALSFLRSASPSYEVLPKPDINSSMLRAADALLCPEPEDDAGSETRKELDASLQNAEDSAGQVEDAKLVSKFLSAVLEEPSSSGGAPAPPVSLSVVERDKVNGTAPPVPSPRALADQTPRCPSLPNQVPPRTWSPFVDIPSVFNVTGAIAQDVIVASVPALNDDAELTIRETLGEIPQPHREFPAITGLPEQSTSSCSDIENLAEILTKMKVAQIGDEHHRRERTLLREYRPAGVPSLRLPTGRTLGPKPGVHSGRDAHPPSAALSAAPAVAEPVTPVTVPPAGPSFDKTTVPPTEENAGVARALSELRMLRHFVSDSNREFESEGAKGATPRRRPSLAEMHEVRKTTSRLVPPSSSRPMPLKRSIRFRRTTKSRLKVIAEDVYDTELFRQPVRLSSRASLRGDGEQCDGIVPPAKDAIFSLQSSVTGDSAQSHQDVRSSRQKLGSKRRTPLRIPSTVPSVTGDSIDERNAMKKVMNSGSPIQIHDTPPRSLPPIRAANVRSEPLKLRSPFAVRKRFSEPVGTQPLTRHKRSPTDSYSSGSVTSTLRSSDLCSLTTESFSSSAPLEVDTDALMLSSISTMTATTAICDDATLSSSGCISFAYHVTAESASMPQPETHEALRATSDRNPCYSAMADSKSVTAGSHEARGLTECRGTAPEGQIRSQKGRTVIVTDTAGQHSRVASPSYYPSTSSKTAAASHPTPLPRTIRVVTSSSYSDMRGKSEVAPHSTNVASEAPRSTSGRSQPPTATEIITFPTPTKIPLPGLANPRISGTALRHLPTFRAEQYGAATSRLVDYPTQSSSETDKIKDATNYGAVPRFLFRKRRDSDGDDTASSTSSKSSATVTRRQLSAFMAKWGILPPRQPLHSPVTSSSSSRETAMLTRRGAGDRCSDLSDTGDILRARDCGGPPIMPALQFESSTSFSLVEDSVCNSFGLSPVCEDPAPSWDKPVPPMSKRGDGSHSSASGSSGSTNHLHSALSDWYTCSSRLSDGPR